MAETKELNLEEFFENLQTLKEVKDLIKAEKENTKTNVFNIFSVLRLETKELIHSKFIAELLNPKGSHGMGSYFLSSFLEKLNEELNKELEIKFSLDELDKTTIEIEKDTNGKGRIDIFIETEKNVIVIENKIYAGDQEKQLNRYKKFLDKKYKNYKILYLTRYGTEPSEYSTGKITNQNPRFWECISYSNTIKPWLQSCLDDIEIKNENIKNFIRQYLEVINILTPDKSFFNDDTKKIKELINKCAIVKQNYDKLLWCLKEYSLVSLFNDYQVDYNTLLWNKDSLLYIPIGTKDKCTFLFYIQFDDANYTNMTYGIWITGGTKDNRANFMEELKENNPKQSGNATWTVKTLQKEYLNSNMSINFSKLKAIQEKFINEFNKINNIEKLEPSAINNNNNKDFTSLLNTYYGKQEHINEIINFIEPDNKKNNKNNNIYEYIPYLEKIEYEWNNSDNEN